MLQFVPADTYPFFHFGQGLSGRQRLEGRRAGAATA